MMIKFEIWESWKQLVDNIYAPNEEYSVECTLDPTKTWREVLLLQDNFSNAYSKVWVSLGIVRIQTYMSGFEYVFQQEHNPENVKCTYNGAFKGFMKPSLLLPNFTPIERSEIIVSSEKGFDMTIREYLFYEEVRRLVGKTK